MSSDHPDVVLPPPVIWGLVFLTGLGLDWLYPLPFVPPALPRLWLGGAILVLAFGLALWAAIVIHVAGSDVRPHRPTTAIVADGPFRRSRNPIYVGFHLGLIGFAVVFDSLWLVAGLVPLYLALRYGVIAREERYLERKFGAVYLDYKAKVRRWV